MTYSFYGTTIPTLRNIAKTAIRIITAAQAEIKAAKSTFPSEQEILDSQLGNMLPLRMQPILCTRFPIQGLTFLSLQNQARVPAMDPSFASLDAVVDFFHAILAVYDAVDETALNAAASKSVDIPFEQKGKTLRMAGLADYFHSFCVPNAYFHLNAMYMLLRSKGFLLGKVVYIGAFMSEQQMNDWKPLHA
ncbi:hypothetical protein ACEQ8H_004277 [Pleosporales sp. CAS-2024a]